MAERMKSSLKVTDEEWSVIQPLLEQVTAKQREASSSRFGGFSRGPGGPGGSSSSGGSSSGGGSSDRGRSSDRGPSESDALRKTLENENASPEELKAKLTAVRDARQKSAAELAQAREELKKVLTLRQEATLVAMGVLE